jgi:antitoxin HigA-1
MKTSFTYHQQITMSDESLPNIHPGEILKQEFLEPMNITPYRLSVDIGVTKTRVSEVLNGKRRISADTALRLARYFGNSAHFWLNLQMHYDITQANQENQAVYDRILTIGAT